MRRGARPGSTHYFEAFRTALADAPAGLLRAGAPASDEAIAAAEARLLRSLPTPYAAFLRSFDGAELFHESVVICGAGAGAFRSLTAANDPPPALLRPGELVFAEAAGGDRFAFVSVQATLAPVVRLRAGSDERWLAGSGFPGWLDALLARESVLYDPEGEFRLDAFEDDGEELTPAFALRQAERALRKDAGSAESHHDLGVACRRLGRLDRARDAFAQAAALDTTNPWPAFDLGRVHLALGDAQDAVVAFRAAASNAAGTEGARLLGWAARAALEAGARADAEALRREAEGRDPTLPAALRRAFEAAAATDDESARAEAEALLAVFEPARRRLPIVSSPATTRPPSRPRR